MRSIKLFLSVIFSLTLSVASARTYDKQIKAAIAQEDWYALDAAYSSAPENSVNPFLRTLSRCLIGNRFNRTDVSIPAYEELLQSHAKDLDLKTLKSVAFMYGMDLSRAGRNAEAAEVIDSILKSKEYKLDSATTSFLTSEASRYKALSEYNPYQISFANEPTGRVTFSLDTVGPKDKDNLLMRLKDSYINGCPAVITFDTGAAVNIVSPEIAAKFNLIPLEDANINLVGMAKRDGYIVIAKELKLGNMTVTDVPFTVIDLHTGNDEADQYVESFNLVVGFELMLQLKDVTLDFINNELRAPANPAAARSGSRPNMCFTSDMGIMYNGTVLGEDIPMNIDTGDSTFGYLGYQFFKRNKKFVVKNGVEDTLRSAGVAGVNITKCYRIPAMDISIGGNMVEVPDMIVKTRPDIGAFAKIPCNVGLKTLMLYGFVRFNLIDFVLTTGLR